MCAYMFAYMCACGRACLCVGKLVEAIMTMAVTIKVFSLDE